MIRKTLAATTLASVDALGLVADTGWVIAETSRAEELPREVGGLSKVREDVYGDTKVTLYECCRSGG